MKKPASAGFFYGYGQPPEGFSGMQLPIDAGALVTTTPGASGAQPAARISRTITSRVMLVPVDGFEPPTNGLQNRCSTTELNRRKTDYLLDAP